MSRLTLYSTDGCHLCERAETVLNEVAQHNPELSWQVVDIAPDEQLSERYGIRIPVILLEGAEYDLGWPFTADDVRRYLRQFQTVTP